MKRLLSLILATVMLISLFPAVSAAERSDVTVEYKPASVGHGNAISKITYDATNDFIQYHSAQKSGAGTSSTIRSGMLSLTNYNSDNTKGGGWVAFEIQVPKAGEYDVYLSYRQCSDYGSVGGLYIMPFGTDIESGLKNADYCITNDIQYYDASAKTLAKYGTTVDSTKMKAYNFTSSGKWLVVFKEESKISGITYRMTPATLTLNGGPGKAAMKSVVAIDKSDLSDGETAQITVTNTMSDSSTEKDTTVSFSSSDDTIATVDANGKVTAVGTGNAIITVSGGARGINETVNVTVTQATPSDITVKYDMTPTGLSHKYLVKDVDYTKSNNMWQFYGVQNGVTKSLYLWTSYAYLTMSSYGGQNGWVAFEINVPKAGKYDLNLMYGKRTTGASKVGMYILPGNTALDQISALTASGTGLITDSIDCYIESGAPAGKKYDIGSHNFKEAGKYILVYKQLSEGDCSMYIGDLTMTGGDGKLPMNVTLSADNTDIEVTETAQITATVYMSDATTVADDTVVYTSLDDDIATVDQTGKVTAKSVGTATIKATGGIGNADEEIDINVVVATLGQNELLYDMTPEGLANSTKLNTITYAETDNTWQYFSNYNGNEKYMSINTSYGYLNLAAYGGKDGWVALKINVPEAGKYGINLTYGKRPRGIKKAAMYILPGDTATNRISALTASGTGLISEDISCYSTSTTKGEEHYVGAYNFKTPGEYIVVYKQLSDEADPSMYMGNIRLDGSNIISEIDLTLTPADMPLLYNNTAQLDAVVRRLDKSVMDKNEYSIAFSSSDEYTASVDANGKILATGDGDAVITVSASDGSRTVTEKYALSIFDDTGVAEAFVNVPDTLYQRETAKLGFFVKMDGSKNEYEIPFDEVTFTVEPEGLVTIEDGMVTAAPGALGEVKISAKGAFHGKDEFGEKTITVIADDGKSESSYFTPEKRAAAKENAEKYSWAKNIVKANESAADAAIDNAMYLYYHVPGEGVPRGRHVGTPNDPDYWNCRYCGVNIVEKYGAGGVGGWNLDVYNRPWKIQCPDCKRLFPSNDFESFLKLGQDALGRFVVKRARQAHHEKFVCESVKSGEECKCAAPGKEYSDEWYAFYGYGLPGGYLYNDLYSELRTASNEMYNKDPYKKDKAGNALPVDGARWGVDDGWGYVPGRATATGEQERCGYIALYNYTMWYQVSAALKYLKLAYVYTDDIKYGRAGAILLDRVADIYPEYDVYPYREYFLNSHGGSYLGSIQGRISDTSFAEGFAEAADAFYPALNDPQVIEFLSEKAAEYGLGNDKSTSKKIWNNWETGILEHIFEMSKAARLNGNYGMNQKALAIAAIALDKEPETTDMIEWIYQSGAESGSGNEKVLSGGNFASQVVDEVDRDGIGDESGANYNFAWLGRLTGMADYLFEYKGDGNFNPYENPKFVQMFVAPTRLVLTESHHVQVGDSGAVASLDFKSGKDNAMRGFANIKDENVKKALAQFIYILNGYSTGGLNYGIFAENPENAEEDILAYISAEAEPVSEMLTGYGFAVLREGKNYKSANSQTAKNNMRDFWMYFGNANSHMHYDALTIGFEAYGLNIAPDLGYPENTGTDPNRLQWVQATISHNTVVVDEKDQSSARPNALPLHFDNTDAVKLMDITAPDAYPQTENYRRSLVMVKVNDDISYGVDFFRVTGGEKHTYSFHSQAENATDVSGLELTPDPVVQDADGKDIVGSYVGPEIPFGDDPDTKYGQDDWKYDTRYPRGYTWMRRPRRDSSPSDTFAVEFDVEDYNKAVSGGSDITLRMTQINNFTPNEVAIVAGYVPRKSENKNIPETLDYVLTQRYANGNEKLDSLFTTVFEPYKGERYIESIEAVTVSGNIPAGEMVRAVKITHTGGKRIDYVVYATNNTEIYTVKDTDGTDVFDFRGFVGVYSVNAEGAVLYRYVNDGDIIDGAEDKPAGNISEYTGTVVGCTEQLSLNNYIDVNLQCDDLATLMGKYIYVNNDGKQNAVYRIDGAAPSPNEDGTIRLDIGMISPIRGHKNKEDVNAGYVYNIAAEQTFRIPMSYSEDYSPIVSPVSDSLTVSAGSSIKVNVSAESPITENAPAISYVGSTLPRGASVNSATGEITWKPDASQVGENHFAITARDADGRESTVHFTVTVYGSTTSKPSDKEETPSVGTTDTPAGGGGGGGGAAPTDKPEDETDTDENGSDDATAQPDVEGGGSGEPKFTDLTSHIWAADAINELAADGIIKGTSSSTFSPAANITRADFALLLVRAFKLTSDNTENFADVSASDYFAAELAIARNTGIVNGIGDNRFAPRNTITRQDMMTIVYRALKKLNVEFGIYDEPQYPDYSTVASYAKEAVTALIGAGLINGKSGRIAPTDYTTRAEVAVLVKRIIDYVKQ